MKYFFPLLMPGRTLQCGVYSVDTEALGSPGWRGGRRAGEVFTQSGYIWDSKDNLITVVALQETSLEGKVTE